MPKKTIPESDPQTGTGPRRRHHGGRAERLAREIPLRSEPLAYNLNITTENEGEAANVAAVKATFDELMRTPTLEQGAVMPDACPAGPMGTIPVGA